MTAVADGQCHGGEGGTALAEHQLEVREACPHGAGEEAAHLRAVQSDARSELFLRDPVQLQVPTDEASDLILDSGGASLSVGVVRPGPGVEPAIAELDVIGREVRGRVAKVHLLTVLVLLHAQGGVGVAAFTIRSCTEHEEGVNNAEEVFETYTPHIPTDIWNELKPFVVETVRSNYTEGRTRDDIHHGLMTLTGFADWVYTVDLGKLDVGILRADVIDAYTAFRATEVAGFLAERERKRLRVIAGLPGGPEKRPVSTNSTPQTPYTDLEQGEIRRWTEWQPRAGRREDATGIAALGLGCGLTALEMMQTRVRDIRELDDGMLGVQTADRVVPVLTSWHEELQSVIVGDGSDYLIGRGYTARDSTSLKSLITSLPGMRPSPQRMRATWMLAHVDAGTPLPDFLDAAGLKSPDVLRRLLPFASRTPKNARTRALRLSTEVTR